MSEDDFALLRQAKERLEDAERRMPLSSRIKLLHGHATKLIYHFREALDLTDDQFNELITPQGGGTPKSDPD